MPNTVNATNVATKLNPTESLALFQKAVQAQIDSWDIVRELEIALVGEDGEFMDSEMDHLKSLAAAAPSGDRVTQEDFTLFLSTIEESALRRDRLRLPTDGMQAPRQG